MNLYKKSDNVFPLPEDVNLGDKIYLENQKLEVVACQETGVKMLNVDADQLVPGDLEFIKKIGLTISNPDTDKPVALGVDFEEGTFGERVKNWFDSDESEDDDFWGSSNDDDDSSSSGGFFGGSFGGGFGGGFGGFGGGGFSGGGASGGF
jgi:uncharacterized membrane protein YgcG